MEELAGLEHHPLSQQFPCRTRFGGLAQGTFTGTPIFVASGRSIVLRIPKQFGRIEGAIAGFLRAPKELRRPLDMMNSLLWELCDGSRTFGEVCAAMNDVFHEDIAPVMQRTAAAVSLFQRNNLMLMLDEPLNQRWFIGPGELQNIKRFQTYPRTICLMFIHCLTKPFEASSDLLIKRLPPTVGQAHRFVSYDSQTNENRFGLNHSL